MLGIIGGSGLTKLANLELTNRQVIRTPYGEPSGALTFGKIGGRDVVFLARHGYGHTIPPHLVNYRANIWALHAQKLSGVVSLASVGGIRDDLKPGTLVIPDQIIDYTWGRKSTFFDGTDKAVTHIDFTLPYCEKQRDLCLTAAKKSGHIVIDGAIYAATQGPRLETAAEINRLAKDGADIVGMTGMPEAALAREIGLSYAAIGVVANYAAGRNASSERIKLDAIYAVLQEGLAKIKMILEHLVAAADGD